MLYSVVCVKDRAIDSFGRPFVVPAIGAAIRSFMDECVNPESEIHRHPDDYDLYELGLFDDVHGRFSSGEDFPKLVIRGKDAAVAKIA